MAGGGFRLLRRGEPGLAIHASSSQRRDDVMIAPGRTLRASWGPGATRAAKTSHNICSVRRFCGPSIFIAFKILVHGLLTPLESMFGVQVQPVAALHRDAALRGLTSILAARGDAVLAPPG